MEVTVIGRKVTITDALNDYAVEKIGNAMKVLSIDIPKAEVVLRVEKNRAVPCICEVTIRPKGHTIHVEEHEEDMYAAIDVAAAKVLRQLRKYKNKLVARQQGGGNFQKEFLEKEADDQEVNIIRTKKFDIKPMYPEDACIQMELLGHNFFAFVNAETDDISVVYKRKGGTYGIMEPDR